MLRPTIRCFAVLLALVVGAFPASARPAEAVATPAGLNYPELRLRAGDGGLERPPRIAPGRVLVTLENAGTHEHAAYLVQPPAGMSVADLVATSAATPAPGEAAPDGPPTWFFALTFLGGPAHAAPGKQAQVIIDLAPGEYGVLDTIAAGHGEPNWLVPLVVDDQRASTPVAPEPPTDAAIELTEFAFAGLPEQLAAGRHIWRVTNAGEQPHELAVARAPDGTTVEQVLAAVTGSAATPVPADAVRIETLPSVGGMASLSPGRSGWVVLDLEPGTYVVFDFFAVAMGMVGVVTVGEPAAAAP